MKNAHILALAALFLVGCAAHQSDAGYSKKSKRNHVQVASHSSGDFSEDGVEMSSGGIRGLIIAEARRQGVPVKLALGVAMVETKMKCHAVGLEGELGPFQVKPATARGLGFRGTRNALNSCGAGIVYGIMHLKHAYSKCGSLSGAAALHQKGLGASCRLTTYAHKVSVAMR